MPFTLGIKSARNLVGVHPDLVSIVQLAITLSEVDFTVFEGVRTIEREREMIAKGLSSLKDPYECRHVPTNGYGHAVDLVLLVDGQPTWNSQYIPAYGKIGAAMHKAAEQLKLPLRWGGEWKTFKDYPHFELPKKDYP